MRIRPRSPTLTSSCGASRRASTRSWPSVDRRPRKGSARSGDAHDLTGRGLTTRRDTVLGELRRRWRRERLANADRSAAIDAIRTSDRFRTGLLQLADRLGRDQAGVDADAARYLDEMVTVQSDALPDFNLVLSRIADRRGFEGVVQYDEGALERVRAYNEVSPLVMMTGHRSYLDFVVRLPFARGGFDRELRFAGANILFWPMGRIGHSAGIIFIRRGFRDPVYSYTLREYVGWLTEHRANFLWALEGGRTRTGQAPPAQGGPPRVRG